MESHNTHRGAWDLTSSRRRYLCESLCLSHPSVLSSPHCVCVCVRASERTFPCIPLTHLDRLVTKRITIRLGGAQHTHIDTHMNLHVQIETLRSTCMHMATLCWELAWFFECLRSHEHTLSSTQTHSSSSLPAAAPSPC